MSSSNHGLLLVQLLEKQSPTLTAVEMAISRAALGSLTIDNFSGPEMLNWGRQYLSIDHPMIMALYQEPNGAWGKAQSILREVLKNPERIQILTNFDDPMVRKLESVVAGYHHYANVKELLEQLEKFSL